MADDAIDYQLLFEHSPDVLLILRADPPRYTMVAATEARFRATHTDRDSLGKGLFELFPDNPDDPSADGVRNLRASLERVIATRAADTMAVQKYDIPGPSGTFEARYWSPKNIPILGPSGAVQLIIHRVEDVTDLVRASDRKDEMEREVIRRSRELAAAVRELREANAKLGELAEAKSAFFSNVSHEFRTPLTLMLGPLEDSLVDVEEPLGPAQRTRVGLAHDNALRLLKLVNALLDFSRLEAGRLHASYAPLDLGRFTAELAGMFTSAVDKAGIRLAVDCPRSSEPAFVDREMWEKIVPNLISNAFKFTLEGEIAVRTREEPERFVVEVADTGVGIPEAELPRIFERFHRVAGTAGRTHEGTGIGLSLVRELVELHGGSISVESAMGRGSTFRIQVPKGYAHLPQEAVSQRPADPTIGRDPAAHAAEAARWAGGRRSPKGPQAASGSRAHVLVVDDNADLREYTASLLAPGYEVTTAVDGQAALEAIAERLPDVVVSDVMMPNLDGTGLVKKLRADPRTASIPVILLSARAGEESAVEGLDAGSDDYLIKPFSARELVARVRTHVELARARHAWIAELERANRELDSFSYSVSHDLRAPLRAIDGFSVALGESSGDALGEAGRASLGRIRANVRRMGTLIDDLLELSRIGRTPVRTGPVDLSRLAVEIVDDLRRAHPTRSVKVVIPEKLVAHGDRNLLQILLVNLIGNAWKFTAKSEEAEIELGRHDGGKKGDDSFFVRDNGAGFDMAHASRLFGAFQRLHAAHDFEGTGIGLATVQRVVARHGGQVWADAVKGRGATFYFSLPAVRG